MLSNCHTQLKFDDFTLEWIPIVNSTMQGCPLSMLFYAFYNALLICIANSSNKSELASGFVDNVMFLAIAKSLTETHVIIKDLMEHAQGALDWSTLHNSPFELSKLALMNFLCSHFDTIPLELALQHSNPNGSLSHNASC
ncbi:hypothetical protein J132_05993 [Termitomyces sp. J132]|nr:hypothetical protein J132_05993 [Termitomyces sp. J132]